MVTDLTKGMIAAGIRPVNVRALASRTRLRDRHCDLRAGAISVPVYEI